MFSRNKFGVLVKNCRISLLFRALVGRGVRESRTRHAEAIPSLALPLRWLFPTWTIPDSPWQPPRPTDPTHTCPAPREGKDTSPESSALVRQEQHMAE